MELRAACESVRRVGEGTRRPRRGRGRRPAPAMCGGEVGADPLDPNREEAEGTEEHGVGAGIVRGREGARRSPGGAAPAPAGGGQRRW